MLARRGFDCNGIARSSLLAPGSSLARLSSLSLGAVLAILGSSSEVACLRLSPFCNSYSTQGYNRCLVLCCAQRIQFRLYVADKETGPRVDTGACRDAR